MAKIAALSAYLYQSLVAFGILAGNAIYCTIALVQSRRVIPLSARWDSGIARRNLVYEGISAGAATLLVSFEIKSILLGSLGAAAARPLLTLVRWIAM